MADVELVDNRLTERRVGDVVERLFEGDGTIYLVTGFFTRNAFDSLRDAIEEFLERSPENELVIVVGASAEQFSAGIARELWRSDARDRIHLYTYPDSFLHAKLYLRDGPSPAAVFGSANLTRVALEQNLELNVYVEGDDPADPRIRSFAEWVDELLTVCEPIRRRDLLPPLLAMNTVQNWARKGTLLPARAGIGPQPTPLLLLAVLALLWFLFGDLPV